MGLDLTTKDGVLEFMGGATSQYDWNKRCDDVKSANGGDYPDFWFMAVILSGLAQEVLERWSGSAEIKIAPMQIS